MLTSFEKGLGCDEERAREPRFLARLQRGDRITGQDRRRGAGVWVRLPDGKPVTTQEAEQASRFLWIQGYGKGSKPFYLFIYFFKSNF